MNKKIKKMITKIGLVSIIIALSVGLLAGGVALAEDDVEPQVTTLLEVEDPGTAYNDGNGVLSFTWEISGWPEQFGTADYYEFQILDNAVPKNVIFSQRSDPPSDTFTTPITPLQNVSGLDGGTGEEIFHPESTIPDTHDWTVPSGMTEGQYSARVLVHLTDGTQEATTNIYIMQAEGCLKVRKESDTGAPQAGWQFDIYGPDDFGGDPFGGTPYATVYTESNGEVTTCEMPVGVYRVVETMQTNWTSITPGGTAPYYLDETVLFEDTVTVTFVNQPSPGTLVVYKYEDEAGDGTYDGGEPLLDGWTFAISGPTSDSGVTVGGSVTFSDIPIGTYTVTETLLAGWRCTDPGPSLQKTGIVITSGATVEVYFGNQELGDLLIYKYEDLDGDGYDMTDPPGEGWYFTVSGPTPAGSVGPTDVSGYILVENLIPGSYTVTETTGPPPGAGNSWVCTDPGSGKTKTGITVPSGGTSAEVQFGNQLIQRQVPTLGQWGIIAMSTVFAAMLVWFGVRRRRLAHMK